MMIFRFLFGLSGRVTLMVLNTQLLRATACKYVESSDRTKILDFFYSTLKTPLVNYYRKSY